MVLGGMSPAEPRHPPHLAKSPVINAISASNTALSTNCPRASCARAMRWSPPLYPGNLSRGIGVPRPDRGDPHSATFQEALTP
jgi:hypothetical protein